MKKSTIALIVAAFVCLGLSVFSVKASVVRTNAVSYTHLKIEKLLLSLYNINVFFIGKPKSRTL